MPNYRNIAATEMIFKIKADFLKSLAHPARLAVIEYLKKGEATVGQIVLDLGIEQSGLSKHLAVLRQTGILASRQERANVYYSIKDKDIFLLLRPIAEMLKKRLRDSEQLLKTLGKA